MSEPNGVKVSPPSVIFEYNPETRAASFRVEGNFPLPELVNILEVAKASFVLAQLQSIQQRPRTNLRMPDGSVPPR